jgi:hypothetical protein
VVAYGLPRPLDTECTRGHRGRPLSFSSVFSVPLCVC